MVEIITDSSAINEATTRSVAEILPTKMSFVKKLKSKKQLTFYVGIDPTADYVHLGHSTNYLMLDRFHKMGHRIIVLVGDFTAMIGDPSDKTSLRRKLSKEEVQNNLKTFKDQISKILNFNDKQNPIEFQFNSKWLSKLTFEDAVELASNFTVQQMIERDAFQKRLSASKPLFIHEFFYPLMQGYDSVAMNVDAEIGGTDQTFNMLAGRTLLKRYKSKNKFVITTTLLVNPKTGEKLMSKSLGTGIGLNLPAKEMYYKVMQLPDEGIIQCFTDCTRLDMKTINCIRDSLESGGNPRNAKLQLADEIVAIYHGVSSAKKCRDLWVREVSKKIETTDIVEITVLPSESVIDIAVRYGIVNSNSEARRLVEQHAVQLNNARIDTYSVALKPNDILKYGKKHTFKIVAIDQ